MTCRQINSELSRGEELTPKAHDHLLACRPCRELFSTLDDRDDAPPSAALLARLESPLRRNLVPVAPLASTTRYFAGLLVIFLLVVALGAYLTRPFALFVVPPLQLGTLLAALALSAALLVDSLVRQMTPGSRHRIPPRVLAVALSVLLPLVAVSLFHVHRERNFCLRGWACFWVGLALAAFAVLPLGLLVRRGAILSPRLAGVATGMLAGLAGATALQLHCPNLNLLHILVWHLGVVALGAMGGLALRWKY